MGKAARLKVERRLPMPARKQQPRVQPKIVWLATAGLATVIAVVVIVLVATRSQPTVPAAAAATAADRNAPASLVQAANSVGFHPTTEPGVGQIEGEPASAAGAPSNPDLLPVRSVAPAFTLRTPQGQRVSLASYRGKAVLLEFFASWCPHCNAEAAHLAKLARSLQTRGVRFLSVNADGETAPSVYAFHRYYGLPYPALLDPSTQPGTFNSPGSAGNVTTAYRVQAFPTFYVINPAGRIIWRGDGEQPDALLHAWLLEADMSRRASLVAVGVAIRLSAAAIWLVAGAAKLVDLEHFHAQVDQYQLLPHALEAPFAYALPFVELLVGLYLAVGLFTRAAAAVGCALMVLFLIAQSQAWARGLSLDCGCFGALTHEQVGLPTILRDLALGLPSLVMLWRPARTLSLDAQLFALPDTFSNAIASPSRKLSHRAGVSV